MDTDDLSRAQRALDAAVEDLRRACDEGSLGAPEPALLAEEIGVVADLVRDGLVEGTPPDPPAARADRLGILERLRSLTLASWQGDDGLLRLVRAFESARDRLAPDRPGALLQPGVLSPYGHRRLREVAHTMRSPLGSVVMLAATLREGVGGDLTALQRKHLGIIHRAVVSLASMSNDLLALTGDEEELRGPPTVFSVEDVVTAVADAVAPVAEERGVELRPSAEGIGRRVGEQAALRRVLMNLALNALLLVREGALEMTAREEGDATVLFGVRATAASEDPETVFVTFPPQGDEGDYTMASRGLGFAVARDLVRRMGSELQARRPPDGGLDLSFSLGLPEGS